MLFSAESSDRFLSAMESCGSSIAATAQASGWGIYVEGSHSTTESSNSTVTIQAESKSEVAVQIIYEIIPTKAFRIPKEEMTLTTEAQRAALAVSSRIHARYFCKTTVPTFPRGISTLAGSFRGWLK